MPGPDSQSMLYEQITCFAYVVGGKERKTQVDWEHKHSKKNDKPRQIPKKKSRTVFENCNMAAEGPKLFELEEIVHC